LAGNPYSIDPVPLSIICRTEAVVIAGSWIPAGTGTTAPTTVRGTGFTVVQTASGVFDVTFTSKFVQCDSFVASIQVAGETTDATTQTGDLTEATGSVYEKHRIRTMTGGTPTDFSGDSQARVSFFAVMRTVVV
jgi:hypothetical protein